MNGIIIHLEAYLHRINACASKLLDIYCEAGMDPGFEKGGAQNARVSAIFFPVPHSLSSPQPPWNYTITTIGIDEHEVVENYNFEALCGHYC